MPACLHAELKEEQHLAGLKELQSELGMPFSAGRAGGTEGRAAVQVTMAELLADCSLVKSFPCEFANQPPAEQATSWARSSDGKSSVNL